MIRKYAYKVVRGELIFNNNDDMQKINELIKEWNNIVLQYANMYAKIGKFIDIQTKLPKNLNKTAKEYAKQLVKRNGRMRYLQLLKKQKR